MSGAACEIVGTGDGKLEAPAESSKFLATDIVLEIVDNAMDLVDNDRLRGKHQVKQSREKSPAPLIGTGDQKSDEGLQPPQETVVYHPPVEKKNRLTDLMKNSKQLLAKIILSDSKIVLQDEKKDEEKVVDVIELDCVHMSDIAFKSVSKEKPPLEDQSTNTIATYQFPSEEFTNEVSLASEDEQKQQHPSKEKKLMTFPRSAGSRAKAAFAAKWHTLKKEPVSVKKKKWDVGFRIAKLFRRKRTPKEEVNSDKAEELLDQEPEL